MAAICIAVLGGGFGALWLASPSVSDAGRRVAAGLAHDGGTSLVGLPFPDRVGAAVVATEDRRFFSHHGVDPVAIARVAGAWFHGGGDQGGATLDQQLAKRLYTPGSTGVPAQIEQVVLGLKLDRRYPKDRILQMYLDAAYFGNGYYGLDAAAAGYFHSSPDRLSWGQASLLAGLVQAPSAYDPFVHLDLARSRQQHVLDRLVSVRALSQQEATAAFAAPLNLAPEGVG